MSNIPDGIKENVRAVLLSKTDGSGILVSTFLRDYKSIIHKPLMFQDLGYPSLEKFIKDIPDVCRLEYSDQSMAFKLFGIAKPNTFVSSFVKRAEGTCNTESDSTVKSISKGERKGREGERIKPSNDLNEKWEPNSRGVYSLCFPNKIDNNLTTKEAVVRKFTQLGEVVDVNIITALTFVRFREEHVAKKAIELYGDELRLRRADEKPDTIGGRNKSNKKPSSEGRGAVRGEGSGSHMVNGGGNKTMNNKKLDYGDDETWDDDEDDIGHQQAKKSSPGGYRGSTSMSNTNTQKYDSSPNNKHFRNNAIHEVTNRGDASSDRNIEDRLSGKSGSKMSDNMMSPVQVYIGNWPNAADENDLKALLRPYDCIGCRILQSKDSSMKKFAFVDLHNERDAQKVVNDLNNTVFKGRDLKCRPGYKKGDKTHSNNDDTHSPGKQPEQFSGGKTTNLNHHSPKVNNSPKLNMSMPLLETPASPYSTMPPLESVPDEMPPLEPVYSPAIPGGPGRSKHTDMPVLEEISPIKQATSGEIGGRSYIPVQLNVGNFPYGTKEYELMEILGMFGAQRITIMNNDISTRSTYAFADFCNVEHAMAAMENLDQSVFKGRKLVVTLSNPGAVTQTQNVGHVPNMSYSAFESPDCFGTADDMSQMSQVSPVSSTMNSEKGYPRSQQQNRGSSNTQRLTTTLQDYTKIATKLRAEEQFQSVRDMQLTVMVTHVENEKIFWAQILQDSINGDNQDLQHLETLASQLQIEPKTTTTAGLGRCVAKFENEWFRGWCTFETMKNGEALGDLIFIDYGNRIMAKKTELFRANPAFWTLPPMAKPFKLADSKPDLQNCLNKIAKLQVIEAGTTKTNSVITVRPLQWF